MLIFEVSGHSTYNTITGVFDFEIHEISGKKGYRQSDVRRIFVNIGNVQIKDICLA